MTEKPNLDEDYEKNINEEKQGNSENKNASYIPNSKDEHNLKNKVYLRTGWFLMWGACFLGFLYRLIVMKENLSFMVYIATFGGAIFLFLQFFTLSIH